MIYIALSHILSFKNTRQMNVRACSSLCLLDTSAGLQFYDMSGTPLLSTNWKVSDR